jgi:hypothetical protein
VKEDDEDEKNDTEIKNFSKQLVGKWKYYAYYDDGDWISIDGDHYIQFNSEGSFSPDYTTWEITDRGTQYNNYGRSYIIELKGSPDRDDLVWQILLRDPPYNWSMEYEYPDILNVDTDRRQYLYVRVK